MSARPFVLAIGIDAAEPALIQRLMCDNRLPTLAALAQEGTWAEVEAPARIGSGAVWPTFIAGDEPAVHGVYGEWAWQPETMSVSHYSGRHLRPFWQDLDEQGVAVGVLDVPFMPRVGLTRGFEVSEWGAHDVLDGETRVSPPAAQALLAALPRHPLAVERVDAAGAGDHQALEQLGRMMAAGIAGRGQAALALIGETRPDLALIVFSEIHHASHHLWHLVESGHVVYERPVYGSSRPVAVDLPALLQCLDAQVARLVQETRPDSVIVFGLHGMRPAHGIPAFLPGLLAEWGYSAAPTWTSRSWRERAVAGLAAVKRRMPPVAKRIYYRSVSQRTAQRLARPTMLPPYDWARTRAFAMPTDQHGWIRLNLRGREQRGAVDPADYDGTVEELVVRLQALQTATGAPLAAEVFRTATDAAGAAALRLPDIVVHWTDAVFEDADIAGSAVRTSVIGTKFSGQHAMRGFCLATGRAAVAAREAAEADGVVAARNLHRLFGRALEQPILRT